MSQVQCFIQLTGATFMLNTVFLLAGFIAISLQTLLLRELLVVFQGNELTIGIMLSQWLLGVAAGSWLAGRPAWLIRLPARSSLGLTFLTLGAYALGMLLLIRMLRSLLGVLPGEGLSLFVIFFSSALVFIPLGILIGAQYTLGVRWAETQPGQHPAARIYLWEALGYLLGGLVFTGLLLLRPNALLLGTVFFGLSVLTAGGLFPGKREKWLSLFLILAVVLGWRLAPGLALRTQAAQYPGQILQTLSQSPYGQYAIADQESSRTVYFNGLPALTLPHADQAKIENTIHLALLWHPAPRRVLLIGGSGEYLTAILEHPVDSLDYVELDPRLIRLLREYWLPLSQSPFHDPRLRIFEQDGRQFLRDTPQTYDVIFLAIPLPNTLAQNRYFTQECYALTRQALNPDGVLALSLPGSLVHLPPALADLTSITLKTLESAFPRIAVLPGDNTLLLAFRDNASPTPEELNERFQASALDYQFLSLPYLDYRLDPAKREKLHAQLAAAPRPGLNTDDHPRALLAALRYWQAIFSGRLLPVYQNLIKYTWLLWPLLVIGLVWGRGQARGTVLLSGSASMGLHLLSLWGFQLASGSLYFWLGLLSAVFMAGLAGGTHLIRRTRSAPAGPRSILLLETLFLGWIALWWLVTKIPALPGPVFFLMSAGSGLLLGAQFPLLVHQAAAQRQAPQSTVAGSLYAADVLGGWLAALVLGTLLIPAWGWEPTILFLLVLKSVSLRWWVRAR